ncbi:Rv1535 family protein [Mycobacterium sp.]|uniref:Rv1535 family protein n=1 Tax=Mycobacterium sp. TaxID=1785 RepID=UPI0025D7E17A|nr:Rv1535 family protein [Mycobacterium sp.]MBW0012932.1 hypothetical protein [Mycobacterium sp.]
MTAVRHDDVATPPPAPRPRPIGAGGDPLSDAAARLLSIPLRQVYALLWRVGLIEVTA